MAENKIVKTDPDPSALTTQQLQREVSLLEKLVETHFGTIDVRFSAMDKAITLLQTFADKSPTTAAVAQSVEALRDMNEVKFSSIETQLALRDSSDARVASVKTDYEKRIADILERQSDKSAILLSGTVDKLGATTNERISAVEKNQYVRGGETSVSDPALARQLSELVSKIDAVRGTKAEGVDKTWGIVAVIATLIISAAGVGIAFATRMPAPIYLSAPPPGTATTNGER